MVEPSPAKGAIVIEKGEDEELRFMWKNRETEETVEVHPTLSQFDIIPADYTPGPHFISA